jgi:hypothetical protein
MKMVAGLVGDGSIRPGVVGAHTTEEWGDVWGAARGGGDEGGGGLASSEAHVGAEPEATAWSATLTRMRGSWVVAGQFTHHVGRERKGVRWRAVAVQAGLVRKVGLAARRARNEHGHFFFNSKVFN